VKPERTGVLIALGALAAFAWGMSLLFRDRLEAGDVYPAYSTLRSDPMGCRAFFSALERYPDLTVSRAFARGDFQRQKPGAVYFFLGLDARGFHHEEGLKELDTLARQGHRVIMGMAPLTLDDSRKFLMKRSGLWPGEPDVPEDSAAATTTAAKADSGTANAKAGKDPAATKADSIPKAAAPREATAKTGKSDSGSFKAKVRRLTPLDSALSLRDWGLRLLLDTAFEAKNRHRAAAQGNRKDTLPWLSALYFDSLKGPWIVLYRRGNLPVAVERPLGKGSLVLVSDSYFASNEAQLKSRPAALTSMLVGASDHVYFDERHFGIRQDDAIAGLLRRYRLHLILPSLLLLLALFIWKTRTALLPEVEPEEVRQDAATAGSALAGLLRRNLTDLQALETSYGLWKESGSPRSRPRPDLEKEISAELARVKPAGNASLASVYGGIQAILNRRKRK